MMKSTPSSTGATSSSAHAQCFDPLDLDSFINYDQVLYPSPSLSPSSSRSTLSTQATATANSNNTLLPPTPSFAPNSQPNFSQPSHRYDLHPQQTGLLVGAIANTLAVNSATRMQRRSGYGMLDAFFTSADMSPEDDLIDFGGPSNSFHGDLDMEYDSSSGEIQPAFFYPESSSSEYINPSAIEEDSTLQPEDLPTSNVGRLYPGMHQQQAALAKAQAEQQKQQAAQQQKQQRQRPNVAPQNQKQPSRPQKAAGHPPTDPLVEDRISRLLSSMRQSSVSSSCDDDNSSGLLPHISRMKKEEEDMDEDERLLASEEGKKLSSKERRQLRNKVSARAFRSRRKEYIGQLEAEVATKTNEANDLKTQNRLLMEENTRLSDLTRMLLSSPSFSNFLDTLSPVNGAPATETKDVPPAEAPRQKATPTPSPPKDANPYAAQQQRSNQQESTHIGMALMPDARTDFSMLDINSNWGMGYMANGTWGTNQPQVFSVLELPEGPAVDHIDTSALSGKSSNYSWDSYSSDETKVEAPLVQRMPVIAEEEAGEVIVSTTPEEDLDESDPAFSLFSDSPTSKTVESKPAAPVDIEELIRSISLEKSPLFELVVPDNREANVSAQTMESFQRMCDSMEAAFSRIDNLY